MNIKYHPTRSLLAEATHMAVHEVVGALPLKEDGSLFVGGRYLAARSLWGITFNSVMICLILL